MSDGGYPKLRLPWHQWWATAIIIVLCVIVVVVSHYSHGGFFVQEVGTTGYLASQYVEVTVQGAVEAPGTYLLPKGADVTRLVELARPLPEADMRVLGNNELRDGQVIKVCRRPMITVYLEGAVEVPGPLSLPKGSTSHDLLKRIHSKKAADCSGLRKKRKLKNQEVVFVPYVGEETRSCCLQR